MYCPDCGTEGAYILEASLGSAGTNPKISISCPNTDCFNYSPTNTEEVEEEVYDDDFDPAEDDYYSMSYEDEEEEDEEDEYDDEEYSDYVSRDTSHITVKILNKVIKTNSILIEFAMAGEPDVFDKRVEFLWWRGSNDFSKSRATLSNTKSTYIAGLDADGRTIHRTHWLCRRDGVSPDETQTLNLDIRVF